MGQCDGATAVHRRYAKDGKLEGCWCGGVALWSSPSERKCGRTSLTHHGLAGEVAQNRSTPTLAYA
jgi:hypothetical protein